MGDRDALRVLDRLNLDLFGDRESARGKARVREEAPKRRPTGDLSNVRDKYLSKHK